MPTQTQTDINVFIQNTLSVLPNKNPSLTPQLIQAVIQNTTGGDSSTVTDNTQGIMGTNPADVSTLVPGANLLDPQQSVNVGSAYLNQLLRQFNGNVDSAVAAYVVGPNVVLDYLNGTDFTGKNPPIGNPPQPQKTKSGVPPSIDGVDIQGFVDNVNSDAGQGFTDSGQTSNGNSSSIRANTPDDPTVNATDHSVIPGSKAVSSSINFVPQMIVTEGLDNEPWYQNNNLLVGNPHLQQIQQFPVIFKVFLDRDSLVPLTDSGNTPGGHPIEIPLNCSLSKFTLTSRHIYDASPTRTGFHITFWGMAADVIAGEGSTGVFLNQFGLTDFLSLDGNPSKATQLVLEAFSHSPSSTNTQVTTVQTEGVGGTAAFLSTKRITPKTPILSALQQYQNQAIAGGPPSFQVDAFRIAAEDAFIELLSLFKMNGTTWLSPTGYGFDDSQNTSDTPNPVSVSQFSTLVGASTAEIQGRNNDVYRRGYVVMNFRNNQYLGYFKTLSWVMDANNPYQWKFSFVFQVERTLSLAYFPSTTPAPNSAQNFIDGSRQVNA